MAYPDDPRQAPPDDAGCSPGPWPADVLCPVCGRVGPAFDPRVSALMEWLGLLKETMKDVQKAAEDLVA